MYIKTQHVIMLQHNINVTVTHNVTVSNFRNDSYHLDPHYGMFNYTDWPPLQLDPEDPTNTNLLGRQYMYNQYTSTGSSSTVMVFEDVIVPFAGNFLVCWENPLERSDS